MLLTFRPRRDEPRDSITNTFSNNTTRINMLIADSILPRTNPDAVALCEISSDRAGSQDRTLMIAGNAMVQRMVLHNRYGEWLFNRR